MVLDPKATGEAMRAHRESRDMILRVVSENMGISEGFLSRLENGLHGWTPELVARYKQACK